VLFLLLFVTTGIGNGSTFRMIPAIFRAAARTERDGRMEAAAALGFTSAVAAYGGFLVPQSYSLAIAATGGVRPALAGFAVFYVTCLAITWWFYLRGSQPTRQVGVSAMARARV
jgi:NNP family nitrate/nitrite transporter-like MFS transporter